MRSGVTLSEYPAASRVRTAEPARYRAEIDGLRAVAVIPVILFHAGVTVFSGGFVGVDVFFVISGYLITTILIAELERGDFSIIRFYERRARRILPALFAVMAFCMPLAWLLMLPNQFQEFGKSLVAVALFGSNFLFWRETGYFATDAELKPLLHTWSLAVEEQYYLLFPIVLWLLWRFGRQRVMWLIAAAGVASLLLSQWASGAMESANFLLAPTRAWELFAGAICAFLLFGRATHARNLPSLLGLGLIVFAVFVYDGATPFPGFYALAPVGGTALIILFAGPGTIVGRLLSHRYFVGVGLISYSAYLWHQPLFAFARLQSATEPSHLLMSVLAVASLILAWLSWKYVEQPFRKGRQGALPDRKALFAMSGLGSIVMIAVGVGIVALRPPTYVEVRNPERAAALAPLADAMTPSRPCEGFENTAIATCKRFGDGPRRIVIWGDSHALMLGNIAHPVPGATVYVLGHWGCPPALGVARADRYGNFYFCDKLGVTDRYERYVESLKPAKVFIVARWTMYTNGRHIQSRLQRDNSFVTDGRPEFEGAASSTDVLRAAMIRTVDQLKAHAKVYVVQQVPDLYAYTPKGIFTLGAVPREPVEAWHAKEAAILTDVERHGASIILTHDWLCDKNSCRTRIGNTQIYKDDNHLGSFAAGQFYDRLAKSF